MAEFNFSLSTEDNHGADEPAAVGKVFVGKYAKFREKLDYSYHKYYSPRRQVIQDDIMDHFTSTIVVDSDSETTCAAPRQNWLVFTGGVMGAGKSHTLKALHHHSIFPLHSFVRVDPDDIRALLPEYKEYIQRDFSTAGRLTQKEVGYLSEVLTLYALDDGKNVLVDGSLRNADWHRMYIQDVRDQFQGIRIAIIHVFASESTVLARCKRREAITGRHVPEDLIRDTMLQLPTCIYKLAPYVDCVISLENEGGEDNQGSDLPTVVESPILAQFGPGEVVPASLASPPAPMTLAELAAYFVMTCPKPATN